MFDLIDARLQDIKFPNKRHGDRYLRFVNWRLSISDEHKESYREEHHILPRSIFPEFANLTTNPWNRVSFTAREHFIAHWMLYKAFGGKMANAFFYMVSCGGTTLNSRLYKRLREDFARSMSEIKMGVKMTPETCAKMSKSKQGISLSLAHRENIAAGLVGKPHSLERRTNISLSKKGHKLPPFSEEHRLKLKAPKKRKKCPYCGESVPLHLFDRWHGENCKLNPGSIQTRPTYSLRTCPHCGKEGKGSNMTRYHFDRCKHRHQEAAA